VVPILSLLVLVPMWNLLAAPDLTRPQEPPLNVSLQAPDTLRTGEFVYADVTLSNKGDAPVRVPNFLFQWTQWHCERPNEQRPRRPLNYYELFPYDQSHTALLQPGTFFGQRIKNWPFSSPGTYRCRMEVFVPASNRLAHMNTGLFESNWVTITVLPSSTIGTR